MYKVYSSAKFYCIPCTEALHLLSCLHATFHQIKVLHLGHTDR